MKHLGFALALLGSCLLSLPFAGCSRHETPVDAARETQTLLLGNGAEPMDLDPHVCSAYTDFNILISLFEGLTVIDEASSKPIPGAASSWDISDDGLRYTFHLRPDGRWSNGDPVTASDFAFSFQRMLSPALATEYAYMLYPIKNAEAFNSGKITDPALLGIRVVDPLTLELTLERPTPQLLALTAFQSWFPVHPPTILKFGDMTSRGTKWTRPENFVGNGPYRLVEWTPHQRIVVKASPTYHTPFPDSVQSVVFFPNDNISADEASFRAGQIHLTYDLLPERIRYYRKNAPELLRIDPLLETWYIRFNVTYPPLNDVRVRRALSQSIDRRAITDKILQGSRLPAFHYTPPNTAGFTAKDGFDHDTEQARKLLAEAGFPGGQGFPKLEVQMNTDAVNTSVLEAIQAMWKTELGIDVRLVNYDFNTYLANQRTLNYQISRSRWVGDYNDPNTYLDMFVTDGGNNQTGWSSPEYDALIESAASTNDQSKRYEAFEHAEEILAREMPIAPVFFGARTYLISPDVKGWVPSILGIHRYQTIRISPPAH